MVLAVTLTKHKFAFAWNLHGRASTQGHGRAQKEIPLHGAARMSTRLQVIGETLTIFKIYSATEAIALNSGEQSASVRFAAEMWFTELRSIDFCDLIQHFK
jgi:hypothetical protein